MLEEPIAGNPHGGVCGGCAGKPAHLPGGAIGQLLFKFGSASVSANVTSWLFNWKLLSGMALYAVSAILFIMALRYAQLSILYPLIATSYIWVTLLATIFLGEQLSSGRWLGIAFIVAGISLIVR